MTIEELRDLYAEETGFGCVVVNGMYHQFTGMLTQDYADWLEEKLTSHNSEYKQSCKGCEFEDISCGTCDTCKNFNMFTPKQA